MVAGLCVVEPHAVQQHQRLPERRAMDGEIGLHAVGRPLPQIERGIQAQDIDPCVGEQAQAANVVNGNRTVGFLQRNRFKRAGDDDGIAPRRRLSDKRVFPAVDIFKSGTRKEELLIDKKDLEKIWILRKFLNDKPLMEAMEFFLDKLGKTKSNSQFLKSMNA